MPIYRFIVASFLLAAATIASAFPFSAKDGVTELTPKTLPGFLKTHKPVFIMFYAPWCGHCKAMHPEWEKLGRASNGVFRVGAINADEHRDLAQQFGIQGFPTIKYWKMGDRKAKAKANDYQGARKFGALQSAALAEVNTKNVVTLKSKADLNKLIGKASSGKTVLLLSSKGKIPPMFGVLAASPALQAATFGFVSDKSKEIINTLGINNFPTVAIVSAGEEKEEGSSFVHEKYNGKIEYTEIAKFVQSSLAGNNNNNADEDDEEKKKKEEEVKSSPPKVAHPLTPVPLTPHALDSFCSSKSARIRGTLPLCVIALNNNNNRDLTAIHARYSHEPVLFFYLEDSHYIQQLADGLGITKEEAPTSDDVLLVRSWKDNKAKYIVLPSSGSGDLDGFLAKVLEGSVAMHRAEKFPTLEE